MSISSSDYVAEITSFFGKETFIERWVFLYKEALDYTVHFANRLETKLNEKIDPAELFFINDEIISEVVLDYFTDIYRIKKFHDIDRINSLKVSAYTIYWILHRKPIQVISTLSDNLFKRSWAAHINESYAAWLYLTMAFNFNPKSSKRFTPVFTNFQNLTLYNFIYRPLSKESLELTLRALMVEFDYPMVTESDCV